MRHDRLDEENDDRALALMIALGVLVVVVPMIACFCVAWWMTAQLDAMR